MTKNKERREPTAEMEELELTAQPSGYPEDIGNRLGNHEVGLSVDPDDLGRTFLADATEQGNFESEYDESVDRYVSSDPRSDDALVGPTFEADHDIWENTVAATMQGGEQSQGPLVNEHRDGMRLIEDEDEATESDGLDLTENAVQDASLMDQEAEEFGETKSPKLNTEDAHTHAKKRGGGHTPKTRAPRAGKSSGASRER